MIPVLDGKTCKLRGFTYADFKDFAALWAEPEVAEFIPFAPLTPAQCYPRLHRNLSNWVRFGIGQFCVADPDGRCGGVLGFFPNSIPKGKPGGDPDWMAGWVLSRRLHGKGIGSEAVTLAHDWLDRAHPGTAVVCGMDVANVASVRLAERNGYHLVAKVLEDGVPGQIMQRDGR